VLLWRPPLNFFAEWISVIAAAEIFAGGRSGLFPVHYQQPDARALRSGIARLPKNMFANIGGGGFLPI
jgi:hypothetical protein